jgi:hypothetical protein
MTGPHSGGPPGERSRGPHDPGTDTTLNGSRVTDADDIPRQLRRRRAASRRLPPLPDGRRDPIDPVPDNSKPATIVVTEDRHSVHFHGSDRVLRAAVRQVGCPYQFDRLTRKLSVPKAWGDRVAVAIETGTPRGVIKDGGLW